MSASDCEEDTPLEGVRRGHQVHLPEGRRKASRYILPQSLVLDTMEAVNLEDDRRKTSLQK